MNKRIKNKMKFYDEKYNYEDFKHPQITYRAFIRSLISKYSIKKNAFVLDIGCGTGKYTHFFAKYGLNIVGIDFSKKGIYKARENYGNEVEWIIGDGLNLPFRKKFDVIFCSAFSPFNIEDLSEHKEIGRSLFKYLKNGGLFIFQWNSNLSDTLSEGGSWNHSLDTINYYFTFLNCGKVIGLYTSNRQLFPILGKYALSTLVTKITSLLLKIHKKSIKEICVIKKDEQEK